MPHPLILILGLFLLTAFLALGRWPVMLAGGLLVGALYLWRPVAAGLWVRLRRLRWLFLSMAVIYGWFTGGEHVFAALGAWSPSYEGLVQGGLRVLNLALVVAAVHWLLQVTERAGLILAIYHLCRPLGVLGLSAERLAVRLVLTLEAVASVQSVIQSALQTDGGDRRRALPERAAVILSAVIKQAEGRPCGVVEIAPGRPPGMGQWLALWAAAGLLAAAAALPVTL